MNRLRSLVMIFAIVNFVACASLRPLPPEVQLTGLEITDMSLSHANVLANLRLFNPNRTDLDIHGMKFALYLNEVRVASGQSVRSFSIPTEAYGDAAVRLSSSLLDLLKLSIKLQGETEVAFRLSGEVQVGGLRFLGATIPIEREGTLPLTGALNQLLSSPTQPLQDPTGTKPLK